MNHDEALQAVAASLEASLEPELRARLDEHLDACAECRRAATAMGWAVRTLEREPDPLSDAHVGRIVAAAADSARESGTVATAVTPAPAVPERRTSFGWLPALAVAAAFLGGLALGLWFDTTRVLEPTPFDHRPSFVLMLEEPIAQWPPPTTLDRPGYVAWMERLIADGDFDGGLRLHESEGWHVASDGTATPAHEAPPRVVNYSGWYVVRADDYDQALEMARRSPHLPWGGILVRRAR